MSKPLVVVDRVGSASVLRLNRPEKKNALSRELVRRLVAGIETAGSDPDVRAVVLTGTGDAFSTGADLQEALEVKTGLQYVEHSQMFREVTDLMEASPKPIIAAINGYCFTGGLEIAMAADIRMATRTSQFAMTSARIGSMAGIGGTQRLPRMIGRSAALELLVSARTIDADRAAELGLVDYVVDNDPVDRALELAEEIADCAPVSVAFMKRAVHLGLDMALHEALALEESMVSSIFETRDRAEGMQAFLERRRPNFRGR